MATKRVDAPILDKLMAEKVVVRDKMWYNLRIGDGIQTLGKSRAKAELILAELKAQGIIEKDTGTPPPCDYFKKEDPEALGDNGATSQTEPPGVSGASSKSTGTLGTNEATPKSFSTALRFQEATEETNTGLVELTDEEKINAQLADIVELTTDNFGADVVFYDGIDMRFIDHPSIQKCPIVIRWQNRGNDNTKVRADLKSGRAVCHKWQVLSKSLHSALWAHMGVMEDHTPQGDYVIRDEQILCMLKKENHTAIKRKQLLNGLMEAKNDKETRQKAANDFGKIQDPEKAAESLQAINNNDVDKKKTFEKQIEELTGEL